VEGESGCPRCWGHTEKKSERAAPHGAVVRGSAQRDALRPQSCGGGVVASAPGRGGGRGDPRGGSAGGEGVRAWSVGRWEARGRGGGAKRAFIFPNRVPHVSQNFASKRLLW
jgi:hypothetical protein